MYTTLIDSSRAPLLAIAAGLAFTLPAAADLVITPYSTGFSTTALAPDGLSVVGRGSNSPPGQYPTYIAQYVLPGGTAVPNNNTNIPQSSYGISIPDQVWDNGIGYGRYPDFFPETTSGRFHTSVGVSAGNVNAVSFIRSAATLTNAGSGAAATITYNYADAGGAHTQTMSGAFATAIPLTNYNAGFVGYSTVDNSPFRWTPGAGAVSLGAVAGAESYAPRILTADGAVLMTALATNWAGGTYIWTESGGLTRIATGYLSPAASSGFMGISETCYTGAQQGHFVVFQNHLFNENSMGNPQFGMAAAVTPGDPTYAAGAMIWSQEWGLMRLDTFLTMRGLDLTGWTIQSVAGISADGRTIAGTGLYNGQARTFVVTGVPTPGAAGLLGLGSLAAFRRRRR